MRAASTAISPFVRASSAAQRRPWDRLIALFASLCLVVVLVATPGLALWAGIASFRAGTAAKHASDVNSAYRDARYAVAQEESLERKYRLEPGPEIRARHRAGAAAMVTALQRASSLRAGAGSIDDELAAHLTEAWKLIVGKQKKVSRAC